MFLHLLSTRSMISSVSLSSSMAAGGYLAWCGGISLLWMASASSVSDIAGFLRMGSEAIDLVTLRLCDLLWTAIHVRVS